MVYFQQYDWDVNMYFDSNGLHIWFPVLNHGWMYVSRYDVVIEGNIQNSLSEKNI